MKDHPLIDTLRNLRGNPRACVYSEPLWYIPFTLYTPFVSVYMAALGLSDSQIGIVASTMMFFAAVSAVLSGAVTDKLGRRMTTLIFDLLSWSLPCLLWAISQNFVWFMFAAVFNGMMQVTAVSWTCLLVEDAKKSSLVRIFSILHIIGQMAVIFAPLAAVMVERFSLIPVMRVLYIFSFTSMTVKFIILFGYSTETEVGKVRMKETSHMSIIKILSGYGGVLRRILASKNMLLALSINAVFNVITMITGNFFGLYTTGMLQMHESLLAYFPIVRSVVIILFIFFLQPKLSRFGFRNPMLTGILTYITGHVILLLAPSGNVFILFVYVFIEACAFSLVGPNREAIAALLIDPDERARISSIMTSLVLCFSMPFGYLAGYLSDINRSYPFFLNIALFIIIFTVIASNGKQLHEIEKKSKV